LILIGLGGNLESRRFGSPRDTLTAALAELEREGIGIAERSGWYWTEPVPHANQPWFVNTVVSAATNRDGVELLTVLQAIETRFGRVRSERNAARVLDLDLLDYHGQVEQTPSLVLPHPRLHQRRFVLVPLAEIAPDWRHPLFGLTAGELLDRLAEQQRVERLPC
jgi:2-amino-4-hydroxy-6-hydroxymethyldihydropteridine diphosphokinase